MPVNGAVLTIAKQEISVKYRFFWTGQNPKILVFPRFSQIPGTLVSRNMCKKNGIGQRALLNNANIKISPANALAAYELQYFLA